MRTTTKYGFSVPSANTDTDDIPTQVGHLGDQIDAVITEFMNGTAAAMPTASILNRYYFIDSGTGIGSLYRDTGSAWQLVNILAGAAGDITTMGYGDTPTLGTPSKGYAPSDHRHGSQANPVVAHVAAANPHPQYLLATGLISNFSVGFHIANALSAGLKKPKWVATQPCTIRFARAICDSGSGATFQVYKNGAAPTGMSTSPAVGTASVLHDFTDFAMAAGDYLQVDVIAPGSGADMSITIDGVWAGPS